MFTFMFVYSIKSCDRIFFSHRICGIIIFYKHMPFPTFTQKILHYAAKVCTFLPSTDLFWPLSVDTLSTQCHQTPNLPQNCSYAIERCGAGVGRDGSCQGIPSTFLHWSVFSFCISVAASRCTHTHYYLTNIYDMFRCVQYVHVHAYIYSLLYFFF